MSKLILPVLIFLSANLTYSLGRFLTPYRQLEATTYQIQTTGGWGSGFAIQAKDGTKHIITNWHVCVGSKDGNVIIANEAGTQPGVIEALSPMYDLCSISAKQDIPVLNVATSVVYKQRVYTRGYPKKKLHVSEGLILDVLAFDMDMFRQGLTGACPKPFILKLDTDTMSMTCRYVYVSLHTSLFVQGGASGSPVVNDRAELVGVVQSGANEDPYSGGIIPLQNLKAFIGDL